MKNFIKISLVIAIGMLTNNANAKERIDVTPRPEPKATRAGCSQTTATIDLDVNNVRARLMNGGDMWWDRGTGVAYYEVPKGTGTIKKNSLFAGSLWIGGYDKASNNTLKVAAQTYRQTGNDYWSGPLDDNGAIDANTCALWDRFWKINNADILNFIAVYAGQPDTTNAIKTNASKISAVIKEWPAKGNIRAKGSGGAALNMPIGKDYAPFVDVDKNGIYDYEKGDYPKIVGDQYIWWIFNDVGNTQTNTGGLGIGLEIQASAFAFATNDCLNEATFYNYRMTNKSTSLFDSTFAATWTDADLGWYKDDYIGCDVARGLGILYNADANDEGSAGYGEDIPMVGVDFFQGPLSPDPDHGDSLRPLKMKYFTYFNNGGGGGTGDPDNDIEHYSYMTGHWEDGSPFVKNCLSKGVGPISNYAYPDDFKECNCNNPPDDRRFVHSAGPFKLFPGISSDITIGAVWVPSVGGNCPSFGKLQICDDKAQILFDGGFKLPFGPQAPDMVIKPFDKKLIFYINNPFGSNNYNQSYGNTDSSEFYKEYSPLAQGAKVPDSLYRFEGYLVYQLKKPTISFSQIRKKDGSIDEEKARLVFQSDKKNGIKNIYNFEKDPEISDKYYQTKLMVSGKDSGIKNNFVITKDAFAGGETSDLVNYKDYYFMVVSYAYNNFTDFNTDKGTGQAFQYLESRTDGRKAPLKVYKVTPHPAYDNLYTDTKATYGDGVEIVRIEGKGNGLRELELTEATVTEIMSSADHASKNPVYKAGKGPIDIKITDPDSLKPGIYTIYLNVDSFSTTPIADSSCGAYGPRTSWKIVRENAGKTDTIYSENSIATYNEKILAKWGADFAANGPSEDWGFSVAMQQCGRPGESANMTRGYIDFASKNGLINSSMEYDDISKAWLYGVPDQEQNSPLNWIRSGDYVHGADAGATWHGIGMNDYDNVENQPPLNQDIGNNYEKILGGTWAPYFMANRENSVNSGIGLMYSKASQDRTSAPMFNCHSVDVVFTSDRSKWTKCCVIEMNDGSGVSISPNGNPLSEGGAYKYNLRNHKSLLRDPDANGNPQYHDTEMGRSWFPGYAINVETGERLNIVFGEDSGDPKNNGNDMIFNPTSEFFTLNGIPKYGGHHTIYITNTKYDSEGGDKIYSDLNSLGGAEPILGSTAQVVKRNVWNKMMWVSPAIKLDQTNLLSWKDGIVPTKATVKIRVARPYQYYNTGNALINNGWPVYQFNANKVLPSGLNDAGNQYNNDSKALLDRLNIVPNPYYGYSEYEASRLDNRVKIINLPAVATIKIYTVDGALIKTINKADPGTTYVEWDLKNETNVPIASGIYLVHIKIKTDQGEKERVLKWFGIMRPIDITQF